MNPTRREFVGAAASIALSGCGMVQNRPVHASTGKSLIDVHCHIFNASDLPVIRFVRVVFLHHYPKQSISTLDVRDPDAVDGLIALLTFILGRAGAPTAEAEIKVLGMGQPKLELHSMSVANEDRVIDATASFLSLNQFAVSDGASPKAIATVRQALSLSAGVMGTSASDEPIPPEAAKDIARKAYKSEFNLGTYLRWFALFTRYRHVLLDQLAADHRALGFEPRLLCPATVDYDHWLWEDVTGSPLPDQVEVMGALARRKDGPAVHGYIAYDPLRRVYRKLGRFPAYDPLMLVRTAMRTHGFLGVKLYPPMGFRPTANAADVCQNYPEKIVLDLFPAEPQNTSTVACTPRPDPRALRLSALLDEAMNELFTVCAEEDAAILAHANDSNGANEKYGRRADPAYWVDVFRAHPKLRDCLAHFGHFEATSAHAPTGSALPESSWEWAFGRFIKEKPEAKVFVDCSYFTGSDVQSQPHLAGNLKKWVTEFDPDCRHLVFGTDWTMTGLDSGWSKYTHNVHEFFMQACGFQQAQMDRLMWGNAATFLGVRQGDDPRKRLDAFYARNGVPATKLPSFL